ASAMIFDDHDVHDDWDISWSWVAEMQAKPWWDARITGAFMAYWIYQHLGNLSPPELAGETVLDQVRQDADGGPPPRRLRPAAGRACASWGGGGTASRTRRAGPTTATSAARGCSSSTRARRACSRTTVARWSTIRSGAGSSSAPSARTTTS